MSFIYKKQSIHIIIYLIFLTVVNLYGIYGQFLSGFTEHNQSIEGSFIALAQYIKDTKGATWYPLWYLGVPVKYIADSIITTATLIISSSTQIGIPHAYRILVGLLLLLEPLTWFFAYKAIAGRTKTAIISTFLFTFAPSILQLLPEIQKVTNKWGYLPWRNINPVMWGDIQELITLTLMPIVLILIIKILKNPSIKNMTACAITISIILLADPAATVSLLIFITGLVVTERIEKLDQIVKSLVIITLLTIGLTAWWFSPELIKVIVNNRSLGEKTVLDLTQYALKISLAVIPAFIAVLNLKIKGTQEKTLKITAFWLLCSSILIALFYISNPLYITEYARFITEWDIAFYLLISLIILRLTENTVTKRKIVTIISLIVIVILSLNYILRAAIFHKPDEDITNSIEYKIAKELKKVNPNRVMVSGSITFWLNVFEPIPQLRGGRDYVATNEWWNHASYQITKGDDAETSIYWMKSLRISHVVVHTKTSREPYHDFLYPEKFEGKLDKVYEQDGDRIYKISGSDKSSMAQIVKTDDFKKLKKPEKGDDKEALRKYSQTLETLKNGHSLQELIERDKYTIKGFLRADEAIAVGISYDNGWQAYVNNQKINISKDVLGNMLVEPNREGSLNIELIHKNSWTEYGGIPFSAIGLITALYLFKKDYKNKKYKKEPKNEEKDY